MLFSKLIQQYIGNMKQTEKFTYFVEEIFRYINTKTHTLNTEIYFSLLNVNIFVGAEKMIHINIIRFKSYNKIFMRSK